MASAAIMASRIDAEYRGLAHRAGDDAAQNFYAFCISTADYFQNLYIQYSNFNGLGAVR